MLCCYAFCCSSLFCFLWPAHRRLPCRSGPTRPGGRAPSAAAFAPWSATLVSSQTFHPAPPAGDFCPARLFAPPRLPASPSPMAQAWERRGREHRSRRSRPLHRPHSPLCSAPIYYPRGVSPGQASILAALTPRCHTAQAAQRRHFPSTTLDTRCKRGCNFPPIEMFYTQTRAARLSPGRISSSSAWPAACRPPRRTRSRCPPP